MAQTQPDNNNANAPTQEKDTIVLAAGGTGGHIFPAEALAEELLKRGYRVVLVTDKRFADYNTRSYEGVIGQIPVYYIAAGGGGGSLIKKARSAMDIGIGVLQARRLLKKIAPKAVVGFGGYPSFPTMMAASRMGLPTVIHEQNSVLGKANRMLADKVHCIATSYQETRRVPNGSSKRAVFTGNPVRAAIKALNDVPYPELQDDGVLRLLVVGGSQGASIFSEVVPEALATLPEVMRQRVRVDQQCRAEALDATRERYAALNMHADLAPFFTDMPARMANAHVVVSRSGASTVAELTAAGRPAILVPYPQATDNHQYFNAQAVEDGNGGWVMPQEGFTPAALAARLESFLNLPSALSKAARNAKGLGRTRAAEDLAQLVLDVAEGKELPEQKPRKAKKLSSEPEGQRREAAA